MRILITGICGFVGSTLAKALLAHRSDLEILGIDNFIRPGSETNRTELNALGIKIHHGDIRSASDIEAIPPVDAVIDAAANPSVLAGVDGKTSSRQLIEHNLLGTINLLELCKARQAAFVLLSTSRVYSIPPLANLAVKIEDGAFVPDPSTGALPPGLSSAGVVETFSTQAPVSLYGSTKLASEMLALEYGEMIVWIDSQFSPSSPLAAATLRLACSTLMANASKANVKRLCFSAHGTFICETPCSGQLALGIRAKRMVSNPIESKCRHFLSGERSCRFMLAPHSGQIAPLLSQPKRSSNRLSSSRKSTPETFQPSVSPSILP